MHGKLNVDADAVFAVSPFHCHNLLALSAQTMHGSSFRDTFVLISGFSPVTIVSDPVAASYIKPTSYRHLTSGILLLCIVRLVSATAIAPSLALPSTSLPPSSLL